MNAARDPLDDPGEGLPVSPARRRFAIAFGILILLLILVALTWFIVTNTETNESRGSLFGAAVPPAVPVGQQSTEDTNG